MFDQRAELVQYMLFDWVFLGLSVLKAVGALLLLQRTDGVAGIEA